MANEKFKISIITVVYNGAETIGQAVRSVLGQDYRDIEYIVIDGGSTDGTKEILDRYAKFISCIESGPDGGIYDAMNKGISHAAGDIVAFLNSDDWYEPGAVGRVARYFEETGTEVLMGGVNYVKDGSTERVIRPDMGKIYTAIPCCHQGIFVRRELFDSIGLFDLDYSVCADYDWILRAYNGDAEILCVEDIFANYRAGGSSSRQAYRMSAESVRISLANARRMGMDGLASRILRDWERTEEDFFYRLVCSRDIDFLKGILDRQAEYYIWGTGYYGLMCCRLFKAMGLSIKGFIDNYKVQECVEGCPVLLPGQAGKQGCICVATADFEEEIIGQLKQSGVSRERYFCFSSLRNKIVSYGMEKYRGREEMLI